MFDYERYDHTYCRITKDDEEASSMKRRFSSASFEGLSDVEFSDQHSPQISVEKDNGPPLNREPVIIVRTKKPRKTAPIIVKTMNKMNTASDVPTVNTASTTLDNSNSIICKNKITNVVAEDATMDDTSDSKPKEKTVKEEQIISVPEKTVPDSVQKVAPIIQTTKSGRTRKLTAKAQQISEESISKARKSSKIKSNASKESERKKSRGRPKKNGGNQIKATGLKIGKADTALQKQINTVGSANSTALAIDSTKQGSNEQGLSNGGAGKTISVAQTKAFENEGNNDIASTSTQPPLVKKSMQKEKKQPAKANTKASSKSSSAVKRSPKTASKSKLVVVTKPPPKRRAQLRAQEQKAAGKGATIGSGRIVQGTRRRR
ncbi:uncharacterized protein DDB_G0286299-like [Watersipora subatra]|uniref:uncharacterized protein DDB_G0286299-like n=1 Tax=Watersipora subatra TaxID=2589382 RepID=UPI00355BE2FC